MNKPIVQSTANPVLLKLTLPAAASKSSLQLDGFPAFCANAPNPDSDNVQQTILWSRLHSGKLSGWWCLNNFLLGIHLEIQFIRLIFNATVQHAPWGVETRQQQNLHSAKLILKIKKNLRCLVLCL